MAMSYQVIARKWRPQTFDEVVGQEHVSTTLKNSIRAGRIGHAYLFTGIRGVGKTTAARILAKALNCERGPTPEPCNECRSCIEITQGVSMDVQEIDGASNRGIDNVRDLREGVAFAPARDRFKVYIIDEVHMLTQEAFNALLKTLEEPPAHVVFIFATTEAHKVPATIASRCQVFEFRRIPVDLLVARLRLIAEREGFQVSEEALRLIAREADGSLRDASSFLDQVASFCGGRMDVEQVTEVLRTGNRAAAREVLRAVLSDDPAGAMRVFLQASGRGVPPRQFLRDVARVLSDALKVRLLGDEAARETGLTQAEVSDLATLAGGSPVEYLAALLHLLVTSADQAAESRVPDLVAQAALVRAAEMRSLAEVRDLISRVEALLGCGGSPEVGLPGAAHLAARSGGHARATRMTEVTSGPASGPPVVVRQRPPVVEPRPAAPGDRPRSRPVSPVGHAEKDARQGATEAPQPDSSHESPGNPVSREAQGQVLARFRKHPVVDKVLEIFGGEIIDVGSDS